MFHGCGPDRSNGKDSLIEAELAAVLARLAER